MANGHKISLGPNSQSANVNFRKLVWSLAAVTTIAIPTVIPVMLMKAGISVVGLSKLLVVPSGGGPAGTWQRSIDMMNDSGARMFDENGRRPRVAFKRKTMAGEYLLR